MSLFNIIIIIGLSQGLYLGFSLISIKSGNKKANRILSTLIFLISFHLVNTFLLNTDYYKHIPQLLIVGRPYVFLFGPIFYLYVKILTDEGFEYKLANLYHVIPFFFQVLYLIPFFHLSSAEKIIHFEKWSNSPAVDEYVITFLQIIHVFIYLFYINHLRIEHKYKLKESFSSIEKINLDWIRSVFIMFMVVFIVFTALVIYSALGYHEIPHKPGSNIIALLASICIYTIGYLGLRQPKIFSGSYNNLSHKKYKNSTLTSELAEKYIQKLVQYMQTDHPYLDSNLTITDLAKQTNIPGYYLSQIINERLNQNFYDFINTYRIEEAKQRLVAPKYKSFTVLAIAYDVGFNSKSVFNTAFKRHTSLTPSQFRRLNTPA